MTFEEFVEINPKINLKKGEEYSFIPMEDVSPGNRYSKAFRTKIYKGGGAKFQEEDIIFARITPCLENGKIAQAVKLKNGLGFGSTEFFVFRGKKEISDTVYIYYLSLTDIIKKTAEKSMSGASGRQRADIESIKSIELDFPDLSTQQKIASILSAYDDLIENNTRRIKIFEEMAQTIYKEWFVNFRFPGHEKVKFVDCQLGKIPEGWEVKSIAEIGLDIIDGDRGNNYPRKNEFANSGHCLFLNTGNIKNDSLNFDKCDFITFEKDNILRKGKLKYNDIILTTRGTVGNVAYYHPMIEYQNIRINSGMLILRPNRNQESLYYFHLMKSATTKNYYQLYASGAAQPQLPIKDLIKILLVIPNGELIEFFHVRTIPLYDLIFSLMVKNNNLRQTRNLLLPKLMSGEVGV